MNSRNEEDWLITWVQVEFIMSSLKSFLLLKIGWSILVNSEDMEIWINGYKLINLAKHHMKQLNKHM